MLSYKEKDRPGLSRISMPKRAPITQELFDTFLFSRGRGEALWSEPQFRFSLIIIVITSLSVKYH